MKDVLFVAAAGNSAIDADADPHYPSSYENSNIIAVAASDHSDVLASFSNYGLTSVDVAAPGVNIVSCAENDTFRTLSGTSMAAPHVAGLAALVKTKYPKASYDLIKMRIMNGVDRIAGLQGKTVTGGRINAANALEDDREAPGEITELTIQSQQIDGIELSWRPSGDDGDSGMASTYEIRYSAEPILTDNQWNKAIVPNIHMSDTAEAKRARISGLPFNFSGYVNVRAIDNVGNLSRVGVSAPFAVAEIIVLYSHDAEGLDGTVAEGKWGLEEVEGSNGKAFSDSPGESYASDTSTSLVFDEITVETSDVRLVYRTTSDIERNYDFGYVEISIDNGASWQTVDTITGKKGWHSRVVNLSAALNNKQSFRLRFRLQADYVVEANGWFIDDVKVIVEAE
jgi:hypothetical protein